MNYELKRKYTEYETINNVIEIGIDEAGRGPLLGRVYTAAVLWDRNIPIPADVKIMDSKKLTAKQITKAAEFIMKYATAYSITYSTEQEIDELNILQATMKSMHKSITNIIGQIILDYENKKLNKSKMIPLKKKDQNLEISIKNDSYIDENLSNSENKQLEFLLLIDGSYFKKYNNSDYLKYEINSKNIINGDGQYFSIACASILAKYSRDLYIEELCKENPDLDLKYKIGSNKGYGSSFHMNGINIHGISKFHRKSFKPCMNN